MIAERLTSQLLAGPADGDPIEVVRRLLAVQGQDPRGARLAIREAVLPENASDVTVNGLFRPFALVRGRAVARWSIGAGELVLAPFARLSRTDERALRDDALDVARYLG
jgi:hypothetical protein